MELCVTSAANDGIIAYTSSVKLIWLCGPYLPSWILCGSNNLAHNDKIDIFIYYIFISLRLGET